MKRLVYILLSILFFILGGIGLLLPVIPQVPFLFLGFSFLMAGSKRFNDFIRSTRFFDVTLRKWVTENEFLNKFYGGMFKDE